MPANVVKTDAGERHWDRAKIECRENGLSEKKDGDKYWACVMSRWKKMGGNAT